MSDEQPQSGPATQPEGDSDASRTRRSHITHRTVSRFIEASEDLDLEGGPETSVVDLIHFLTKTSPPPSNYMSIPDNSSSGTEDDRWDRLKRKIFRYRGKARKRRPPVIMLPDSAVSARTTGGHRYIAISIPLQHSPLAALTNPQYPIYGSIEAAFAKEVNSMYSMPRKTFPTRLVPVLNPVVEDRESTASSSPERPPRSATPLTSASRRARSQSIPLLPSQEQRYTPCKPIHLSKSKSVSNTRSVPPLSDTTLKTRGDDWKHISWPVTAESIIIHPFEKPTIFPPRRSSKRGKGPELAPSEPTNQPVGTAQNAPPSPIEGNSNSNGERGRPSVSASIDTTGSSSPQLLKAQTATAVQPVPIIVTQTGSTGPESPLDPTFTEFPAEPRGNNPTTSSGPPPSLFAERAQHRKKTVRERKAGKTRVRIEHKGKGKERVSRSYTPDMPASSTEQQHQRQDTTTTPSSTSPSSSSSSTHRRGAQPTGRRESRAERDSRFIARALAEQRETLENLSREELIQRYEALRESRAYERERRLRRLERSRDTWIRAVPMLLQDLNGLLREQHRLLEGYAFPVPAGQYRHHREPRSRSVEASPSASLSSGHGVDLLETRRSKSVHGSSEARSSH
ncbi:hypothetical protein F5B22DRAFT_467510 [Xylaria bambusicola]|uniref:uncharacterized protein n=1 Tax=Xylaria bambusicola TaxID=326684 RepID=UPI0020072858|nr:uncharacterized protein F5B22DRAFT_467510 [Xylaria bambusicola]KAI0522257.1 hypothetical protein F5B22DRAFT_467510 [Xylaria bambusicola]